MNFVIIDLMKKNSHLVKTLCLPYCLYYKPGKNEELLCRGAVVVERLMATGKNVVPLRTGSEAGKEIVEQIVQNLCAACDFREHDCDFMLDRKAGPCGGLVLIQRLLASGAITIEDVT
jgi:hypothetical protein